MNSHYTNAAIVPVIPLCLALNAVLPLAYKAKNSVPIHFECTLSVLKTDSLY